MADVRRVPTCVSLLEGGCSFGAGHGRWCGLGDLPLCCQTSGCRLHVGVRFDPRMLDHLRQGKPHVRVVAEKLQRSNVSI